jgi:hypothetical protein
MPPPNGSEAPPARPTGDFPTSIKVAGLIWLGTGILGLIRNAVLFANDPIARNGGMQGCGLCCFCGIVDLMFLGIGYETISWRVRWSTFANGVASIIVGWAYAAQAVLVIQATLEGRAIRPLETWLIGGLSAFMSVALVAAGVLAIAGWRRYSLSRAGSQRLAESSQEQADFGELSHHPEDEDEE